jgi:hypothetical protein
MTRAKHLSITTWLFAALAAALGVYVYLAEVRGGERRERTQQAAARLLSFPAASATELVIARPDARIVCRKEPDRWRIVAPIRADADETTLTRLLEDIGSARIERSLSNRSEDLAAYGLTHPVLLMVAAGSRRQSFRIGRASPTGEFVFVRREQPGAPVLLVERRLRQAAEKTLTDLREKSVFTFAPEDVTAVDFVRHGRRVRLVRAPTGTGEAQAGWQITEPLPARADRGLVDRHLELLSGLRAEDFVSETQAGRTRYGLAVPWGSARFALKGGRAEMLSLGSKTVEGALTRWYACRPGTGPIFTINDNLPGDVQRTVSEWRERHVTDFAREDVAELRLLTPQRTVVCAKGEDQKRGAEWRLAEYNGPVAEGMRLGAAARMPGALRADPDRVEDLIGRLATLQAGAFLDGARPNAPRFGLTRPALKVTALDRNGRALASVSFGARQGTDCFATNSHLGDLFLVPAADVERFRVRAENLAARR